MYFMLNEVRATVTLANERDFIAHNASGDSFHALYPSIHPFINTNTAAFCVYRLIFTLYFVRKWTEYTRNVASMVRTLHNLRDCYFRSTTDEDPPSYTSYLQVSRSPSYTTYLQVSRDPLSNTTYLPT